MLTIIRRLVRAYAFHTGKGRKMYLRLCHPSSSEWGAFLTQWGGFEYIGKDVFINMGCNLVNPGSIRIGNNVSISCSSLLADDEAALAFNKSFGTKLKPTGKIDIRDNSFIGHGAIVMPNVTIGPDTIVAAGTVVTQDIPPGVVVGGNPARVLCKTTDLVERIEERCNAYPWMPLIRLREGTFDPAMEPTLVKMRTEYFFGNGKDGNSGNNGKQADDPASSPS